ncbi:MAG: phytanoyl-CoA dioxygenase family protein [Flavisolibacter sp.]
MDKTDELQKQGYCLLKAQFDPSLIDDCRVAFLPTLKTYLENNGHLPNRGTNRHFLPMPFDRPCFNPAFFFDTDILAVLKNVLGDRIVADQWGCDVPLSGSDYQAVHVDYQRPLFQELPELKLPAYMMVVSFGLTKITQENGAIEIAPGTQNYQEEEPLRW